MGEIDEAALGCDCLGVVVGGGGYGGCGLVRWGLIWAVAGFVFFMLLGRYAPGLVSVLSSPFFI